MPTTISSGVISSRWMTISSLPPAVSGSQWTGIRAEILGPTNVRQHLGHGAAGRTRDPRGAKRWRLAAHYYLKNVDLS